MVYNACIYKLAALWVLLVHSTEQFKLPIENIDDSSEWDMTTTDKYENVNLEESTTTSTSHTLSDAPLESAENTSQSIESEGI